MSAAVVDVRVERTEAVTVTYDDDAAFRFGLAELRSICPCATCRSVRDQGGDPWPDPDRALTIVDAELVGAWGMSFTWSDGHSTGIYPWDVLRRYAAERDAQ